MPYGDAVDKNHKPICQQFLCDLFDPFDPFWRIALNVSRYKSAIKYMKGSKGQKGQLIFLYMPCDSLVTNPSSSHALFHRIAVRREIPILPASSMSV